MALLGLCYNFINNLDHWKSFGSFTYNIVHLIGHNIAEGSLPSGSIISIVISKHMQV